MAQDNPIQKMKDNMITEQDLIDFGFKRNDVTAEESGADNDFYYYSLDIKDFCLMSRANDEKVENDSWNVYIFDYLGFEFTEVGQVAGLINALKTGIKNNG